MPICLVSKGKSPTGRIECITASQSCYQLQLNPADFGNMPKNMFSIVIAYNGRDHFVPTIPCSEKDYLAWKVHKEFGSLGAATLLVTKELDRPSLPAGAAQGIKAIEKAIEENLPKISEKSFPVLQHFGQKNKNSLWTGCTGSWFCSWYCEFFFFFSPTSWTLHIFCKSWGCRTRTT